MKITTLIASLAFVLGAYSLAQADEGEPVVSWDTIQRDVCQSGVDDIEDLKESLVRHFGTSDISETQYRAIRCGSAGDKRSLLVYVKSQEPFKAVFNLIWARNKIKTDEDACCLHNYASRLLELSTGSMRNMQRLKGVTQAHCSNPAAYSDRQCGINI
ncbi:MAG: hypothetical protein RJS97_14315 [Parvibaculaceae bacterium]